MTTSNSSFAVVTGASAGIGYELARCCAKNDFDLLIASEQPKIRAAADELRAFGGRVEALEVDLATTAGVDRLHGAIGGRPVDALLANAGQGLGGAFLDQSWDDIQRVIDNNVTGTLALIHRVGRDMVASGQLRGRPSRTFAFSEVPLAHQLMERNEALGKFFVLL